MKVTVANKSTWSDESLQTIVDFLAPCYAEVGLPVRLTFRSRAHRSGTWGKAFWPVRWDTRPVKVGEYAVVVYIGDVPNKYPYVRTYKKTAKGFTATCLVDEIVHTIAHELRHVEQFEACRVTTKWATTVPVRLETSFGKVFRHWEKRAGFPRGSCEVDAEMLAHGLLKAYHTALENRVLTSRPKFGTLHP